MEIWKDVVGWEGIYFVSNKGNIRSILGNRLLKTNKTTGYHRVRLTSGDRKEVHYVHRLVAISFLGEELNKVVNHKDENKMNNELSNLEWVSAEFNFLYSACGRLSKEEKLRLIEILSK